MSYADFLCYFSDLYVVKTDYTEEYRSRVLVHRFTQTGGISSSHFEIEVLSRTELIFGLHQEDLRGVGVKHYRRYLDVGIVVLSKGRDYQFYGATSANATARECQLEITLGPGVYVVVPISTGCTLSASVHAASSFAPLLTEDHDFSPVFKSTIKDIFRTYDLDMGQTLGYTEFKRLLGKLDWDITPGQFNSSIKTQFNSTEEGLNLQGLFEFFMQEIRNRGEGQVRKWMTRLGYDEGLHSVSVRAMVFTAHSRSAYRLQRMPNDPEMNTLAWNLAFYNISEKENIQDVVELYTIKHSKGASFAVKNISSTPASFDIEFTESRNVVFLYESIHVSTIIQPGEFKVLQHLHCDNLKETYKFAYSIRITQ